MLKHIFVRSQILNGIGYKRYDEYIKKKFITFKIPVIFSHIFSCFIFLFFISFIYIYTDFFKFLIKLIMT